MKTSVIALAATLALVIACNREESKEATSTAATAAGTSSAAAPASPATTSPTASSTGAAAESLLTPADVEKVSGQTGVHSVPQDPSKGAGGDVNYADGSNRLLVMMNVQGRSYFDQMKGMSGGSVSGLGDEAFKGPSGNDAYMLVFRKGERTIAISSFLDDDMKPRLTEAQLKQLGEIVASKI